MSRQPENRIGIVSLTSWPILNVSAPPSYEDCTNLSELPTYEEACMETHLDGEMTTIMPERIVGGDANIEILPPEIPVQTLSVLTTDSAPYPWNIDILGTNLTFTIAFLGSLIFFLFGLDVVTLICLSVAACLGAYAGFQLSSAKLIMKERHDIRLYKLLPENLKILFIWWLVIAFGCIICTCAAVNRRRLIN